MCSIPAGRYTGRRMRVIGKILAYLAVIVVLALVVVAGAFFLECASWGQCPSFW